MRDLKQNENRNTIKNAHLDWWEALPTNWKRIFCAVLYQPELMHCIQHNEDYTELEYTDESDDVICENILACQPVLKKHEDLLTLFSTKYLIFNQEPFSPSEQSVDIIPPLHYFHSLAFLSLPNNYIKDIRGLSGMKCLKSLSLEENAMQSSDLAPLATLEGLTVLDLAYSSFNDVSVLSSFTTLKHLRLCNNAIEDISPLSNLIQLEYLDLSGNPVNDFSALAGLTQLKQLDIEPSDESAHTLDLEHVAWLRASLPDCDITID